MSYYDISLPLSATVASWPGDTPFCLRFLCTLSEGASVNLGTLELSAHMGTHADAPFHYDADGKTVEALSLTPFLGNAVVLDMRGRQIIRRADILEQPFALAPRVLFRTDAWTDYTRFPEGIPVMESGLPAFLAERGVILIGMDVPSVDAIDSKNLPIHHEIGRSGIHILESLRLHDVPPGEYELIALPLKIVGGDGSPVRAILRTRNG